MDKRSKRERQLEAFMTRLAGEFAINPRIELRFLPLETDGRANMLKRFAEEWKMDPSLIDDFDLQGIEVSDFRSFLMEGWEKSGAVIPMFGPERRLG